ELPLPPLAFLRRWRLPPGVLPLRDGQVRPLPSPDAEPDERARGPKDFGALSSLVLRPLAIADWEARQRQEVGAAARAGRPPAGGGAGRRAGPAFGRGGRGGGGFGRARLVRPVRLGPRLGPPDGRHAAPGRRRGAVRRRRPGLDRVGAAGRRGGRGRADDG